MLFFSICFVLALCVEAVFIIFDDDDTRVPAIGSMVATILVYGFLLGLSYVWNMECIWKLQTQQSIVLPNSEKITKTLNTVATLPTSNEKTIDAPNLGQSVATSQALIDYGKAVNRYNEDLRQELYCRSFNAVFGTMMYGILPDLPDDLQIIKL